MNNNWDTDHFGLEDLTLPVTAIHICGYINEDNAGDEDGNPLGRFPAALGQRLHRTRYGTRLRLGRIERENSDRLQGLRIHRCHQDSIVPRHCPCHGQHYHGRHQQ